MPSTLVVAGAAFLGGMATSSIAENSTKSRILAHTKTGATLGSATLAARKKMSGGVDYERGEAAGYAECRAGKWARVDPNTGFRDATGMSADWINGFNAGCARARRVYPSVPIKITVRNDDEPKHWYNW